MNEQPENQEEKQELSLPRHIARIVEDVRNKAEGYRAMLKSQSKTPSKYILRG